MSSTGYYIYTVIIAAIFVAVLQSILPGKSTIASMIRLTTGIFLFVIVISPLVRVRVDNMIDYISYIQTDATEIIKTAQERSNNEIKKVIKQNTEEYILGKASSLGAEVTVDIILPYDGSSVPERIKIIGPISPMLKKQLSTIIAEDLGISEDMQIWGFV